MHFQRLYRPPELGSGGPCTRFTAPSELRISSGSMTDCCWSHGRSGQAGKPFQWEGSRKGSAPGKRGTSSSGSGTNACWSHGRSVQGDKSFQDDRSSTLSKRLKFSIWFGFSSKEGEHKHEEALNGCKGEFFSSEFTLEKGEDEGEELPDTVQVAGSDCLDIERRWVGRNEGVVCLCLFVLFVCVVCLCCLFVLFVLFVLFEKGLKKNIIPMWFKWFNCFS